MLNNSGSKENMVYCTQYICPKQMTIPWEQRGQSFGQKKVKALGT